MSSPGSQRPSSRSNSTRSSIPKQRPRKFFLLLKGSLTIHVTHGKLSLPIIGKCGSKNGRENISGILNMKMMSGELGMPSVKKSLEEQCIESGGTSATSK
ncbi:hypothetical protein QN277_022584 [Acacia crassicarpa]|uniref:Uncharacterized protein n=1 Tax=Acacia crassicarpa TaxID=499986 RepID=A0AAE1MQU6_9FABA|nr:hypothetical protein QN277_022584 [Acacia crassicarpa]